MNIRPSRGTDGVRRKRTIPQLRPVSQEPISCHGDACARAWCAALAQPRTPELCLSIHVAETTSPLPLPPVTAPIRARRCRATPHACWPSCSPPATSAASVSRRSCSRGSASRCPGRCAPWPRLDSCRWSAARLACPTRTSFICRRCGHEMPPPGEGVRPRPRRAAGPQRQGPYSGLRARLERPEPAAGLSSQHTGVR